MKYLCFINILSVFVNKQNYKTNILEKQKNQNPEMIMFCKYNIDCPLPLTCKKIFGDFGICKINANLIPIPIPNN
jgi:hypothetical protein